MVFGGGDDLRELETDRKAAESVPTTGRAAMGLRQALRRNGGTRLRLGGTA